MHSYSIFAFPNLHNDSKQAETPEMVAERANPLVGFEMMSPLSCSSSLPRMLPVSSFATFAVLSSVFVPPQLRLSVSLLMRTLVAAVAEVQRQAQQQPQQQQQQQQSVPVTLLPRRALFPASSVQPMPAGRKYRKKKSYYDKHWDEQGER